MIKSNCEIALFRIMDVVFCSCMSEMHKQKIMKIRISVM